MSKLDQEYIINSDTNIFGDWINNVEILAHEFINNKPFPHIILGNFLKKVVIENIYDNFPSLSDDWWVYNNPIEVKYAHDQINLLHPCIKNIFCALATPKIIEKLTILTGIPNLEYDPCLHGAGLHLHPNNGRLMLHLDYEKHPILTNKQRRLNIILYLSKDWNPMWNGATELWNSNMSKKEVSSEVIFNNAIIFQTTDESWHGLPEKIKCPEDVFRKSLAFYYISPLSSKSNDEKIGANEDGYRTKAIFTLKPSDNQDPRILKLLEIRPRRRITEQDMYTIYPDWDKTL